MVVARRNATAALLLLLFLLPRLAAAQEGAPSDAAPAAGTTSPAQWKLMLQVDQQHDGSLSEDELFMISRSLLVSLQDSLKGITFVASPERTRPALESHLGKLAESVSANGWLWVQLSVEAATTRLRVKSYDLTSGRTTITQGISREGRLTVFDLPFEKWQDLAGLVKDAYPVTPSSAITPGQRSALLEVKALPGSSVGIPGTPPVTADSDGIAELTLSTPAEYTVTATLDGYHEAKTRLFLAEDRTVELEQKADSTWSVEASMQDFGYPGFSARWFPTPGLFWVRAGLTTYLLGLDLRSQGSDSTDTGSVISSNPLTNISVAAGIYFTPKDRLFRGYAEAEIFLRVFHPPDITPRLEPVSGGGFRLAVGTELAPWAPQGAFFLEYTPTVYLTGLQSLFKASLGQYDIPPGWLFPPGAAINLLTFRVGYRWFL
jgi:hypothetical protein